MRDGGKCLPVRSIKVYFRVQSFNVLRTFQPNEVKVMTDPNLMKATEQIPS